MKNRWEERWVYGSEGEWRMLYELEPVECEYGIRIDAKLDWVIRRMEIRLTAPDERQFGNMSVVLEALKDVPFSALVNPMGVLISTLLPEPDMVDVPKEFGSPVPIPMWDLAKARAFVARSGSDDPVIVEGGRGSST